MAKTKKTKLTWGAKLKAYRLGARKGKPDAQPKQRQVDFAAKLGISQPTLSDWENDRKLPRYEDDIAKVRKVTGLASPHGAT